MARVLLIETDKPLATNLQSFLRSKGHEVDWQVDAQKAVNSTDSQLPDVVVMDLLLAGHSGVEFLYELRSYPEWQQLPVVVFSNISAGELGSTVTNFEELGISAFHYKPLTTLNDLTASIDRLLQPTTQ